jgi:hypothetical protein
MLQWIARSVITMQLISPFLACNPMREGALAQAKAAIDQPDSYKLTSI